MFKQDYSFRGTHAEKVKALVTYKFDKEHTLFSRNMDVYMLAPIVGFLYNRKADLDRTNTNTTNILAAIMIQYSQELLFNYRLIMLLDSEYEPNVENRMNKAFRDYAKDIPEDIEEYEKFVRGGVDVLYEKLFTEAAKEEDYIRNLYEFMEDFEARYSQNSDEIIDLCKLARE
jgi:phosphoglycolate phosphatase-like HAD superfamily hydrolase